MKKILLDLMVIQLLLQCLTRQWTTTSGQLFTKLCNWFYFGCFHITPFACFSNQS
jgi:hypothetical protein